MAASRAQIIANRLNALRSTGPKTDEGKARSRRNATTHGLSRLGVVPPEFMADAIADRRLEWRDSYRPADATQEWFFGLLCAESVRVDFCDARIVAARAELAERASESWDDDRALDASKLGAKLSTRPELIQQTLLQSRHGVLWLLDRWEEVAHQLRAINGWSEELWQLALDLLGLPIAARRNTGPWSLDLDDAGPEPGLALVREATDALRSRLADTLDARDSRARLDAELGLSTDDPPPLRLLHRYAADARRQVVRNLTELLRLQRLDPRSPSSPAFPSAVPDAEAGPPGPRPDRSKARERGRIEEPAGSPLDAEVDAMVDALLADFWGQRPSRARPARPVPVTAAPRSPAAPSPTTARTLAALPDPSPLTAAPANPDLLTPAPPAVGDRPPGLSTTLTSTRPTADPSHRSTPSSSSISGPSPRSTPDVPPGSRPSPRPSIASPTPGASACSTPGGSPRSNPLSSSPASPEAGPTAGRSPAQVVAARFSPTPSAPSPAPSSNEGTARSASPPSPTPNTPGRSSGLAASLRATLGADRPLANRRSRRAQAASSRRS